MKKMLIKKTKIHKAISVICNLLLTYGWICWNFDILPLVEQKVNLMGYPFLGSGSVGGTKNPPAQGRVRD